MSEQPQQVDLTEERILNAWRDLPFYRRPPYIFNIAYERGYFWVEMMSAFTALLLSLTAFQDVLGWPLTAATTRFVLGIIFVGQMVQVFLRLPFARWTRLVATTFAAAWWCGNTAIFVYLGEVTLASFMFTLFSGCFLSLVQLSGAKL